MQRALVAVLLSALSAILAPGGFAADPPRVVTTIPPIHSLVASVMEGIGTPALLVPGGRSPHDYALKPSDARALADADVIVWIGGPLELWLEKPLAALARRARIVTLIDNSRLKRLPPRSGGVWERDPHDHDHRHERDGADADGHLWLSPGNGKAIGAVVADALAAVDPANAARYRANAARAALRIDALDAALRRDLAPVQRVPYVVFHDAYRYFEDHYGLSPAGAISIGPERMPGAKRIAAVRRAIQGRGVRCVFREPQFEPALARTVVAGTPARVAVLDPLGAAIAPGPDLWFALMRGLGAALAGCLAAHG